MLYFHGRIADGIYANCLLINPVPSAVKFIGNPKYELPYEGEKGMIPVEDADNREYLENLLNAIFDELQVPRIRKSKEA